MLHVHPAPPTSPGAPCRLGGPGPNDALIGLAQVLRGIWPGQATEMRELIVQTTISDAAHDWEDRPGPADLEWPRFSVALQ